VEGGGGAPMNANGAPKDNGKYLDRDSRPWSLVTGSKKMKKTHSQSLSICSTQHPVSKKNNGFNKSGGSKTQEMRSRGGHDGSVMPDDGVPSGIRRSGNVERR